MACTLFNTGWHARSLTRAGMHALPTRAGMHALPTRAGTHALPTRAGTHDLSHGGTILTVSQCQLEYSSWHHHAIIILWFGPRHHHAIIMLSSCYHHAIIMWLYSHFTTLFQHGMACTFFKNRLACTLLSHGLGWHARPLTRRTHTYSITCELELGRLIIRLSSSCDLDRDIIMLSSCDQCVCDRVGHWAVRLALHHAPQTRDDMHAL
jgi:hypothetical protein